MSTPLVSVIVPTFNRAYCLNRAVDSVLAQTHANCEVIIVDDGSSDDTAERVQNWYGGRPNIHYLWQENRGVSAARNTGLRTASGDYIALLDSDDIWLRWKIELQLACLAALPQAGMIWTDMEAVDPAGMRLHERYLRIMYNAYQHFGDGELFEEGRALTQLVPDLAMLAPGVNVYWGDIFSQMVMGNLVHTSTVLLRRERFEKVKGFDEALQVTGEDYDFHLRTCREGPVAFLDAPSILYQVGGADQLTHPKHMLKMAQNFVRTIEPVIERDRARINLPDRMLRKVIAGGHAWVGRESLKMGLKSEARHELAKSLKTEPWHVKLWLMLIAASLPGPVTNLLQEIYRWVSAGE
jgi:glycosyltransferase involved in cell wall biosynthesis